MLLHIRYSMKLRLKFNFVKYLRQSSTIFRAGLAQNLNLPSDFHMTGSDDGRDSVSFLGQTRNNSVGTHFGNVRL